MAGELSCHMILSVIIVNSKNCKKMYLKCHFFKKKNIKH